MNDDQLNELLADNAEHGMDPVDEAVLEANAEAAEETGQVTPPPVIDAPPAAQPGGSADVSDDELRAYAIDLLARENPAVRDLLAQKQQSPAAPSFTVPDDVYDPDQRAVMIAQQVIKHHYDSEITPLREQLAQQAFVASAPALASELAQAAGNPHAADVYRDVITQIGPGGLDAYRTNPVVKSIIDDAVKARVKPPATPDDPLPAAGLSVGGKKQSSEDAQDRAAFERAFAGSGLKYEDLLN